MARWTLNCHECGETIALEALPGRSARCAGCEADVRVCLNCRHYDRSASNQCREPQADFVHRKDRATYCDYFEPRKPQAHQGHDEASDALAKLNALFSDLDD